MKKTYLKLLLTAVGLLVGSGAWAGDKTVVKYSFDDASSPAVTAGSRVSLDYTKTSVITNTKFLNAWNNTNGDPGASTISLGSTDLSEETWTLSFEWAAVGGCNSKPDHTTLKAGDVSLFDLSGNSNWNTTVTLSIGGTATATTLPVPGCDKNKRFKADTGGQMNTNDYWHHIVITGSSEGVKLTITNSNSGDAVVTDVVLSETNVNPTSLIIEPCCGGAIGIDELSLSYYVAGEVIQTPVAAYTAVDGINRTITATCDTEGTTLYYSTDGENWTEGAQADVNASGNIYFKAVKGTSESDVLTFAAEAGTAIVLNAPTIARNENGTVTISADQTKLLLSPTATIYYTYGEENGSFTGTKQLTVAADATITAYAEADGYTTSENATRAVALFPEQVNTIFSASAATSGWSANTFSATTITASERTYATLLLDDAAWNEDVLLQTDGAWGLRSTGNWYINSNTANSWFLIKDAKAGDIVVTDVTYAPVETVNATYAEKYSFGGKHAFIVDADGNAEFAVIKPSASTMDYLYGVYSYRAVSDDPAALAAAKEALQTAIGIASNINPTGFADAISAAQTALNAEDATVASIAQATQTLEAEIKTYFGEVLPKLGAIVTALNDETLNTAYATAQTTLAKEDVTPQELATAMQGIITAAQGVAPAHLQNLKGYAVKYGATDAATLIDNALAAIEAGNVAQIIATMTAVKEAATPLAQTVLGTMKTYVQQFGLTDQAAQAQAALDGGNYITMITTAKALFTHLVAAAQTYLPSLKAIVGGLNDATLNAAYADAVILLAKESITPEELGTAMQNIITAAQAVAPEHLQNLRGYAVKYGEEDAVAKVDAAIAAIEAGNVSQIIATMTAVKVAATPLAESILTQMIGYAQSYPGFAEDVTTAQAALEGGNYISMIITAKALYDKLIAAANDYVTSAKAIPTEGKTGVDDLNSAIYAAEQALGAENPDFSSINTAISNLVAAVQAFQEANASDLMKEAKELAADEDAVAVGKLLAAIADAEQSGDETELQTAVNQFKADNAPLETDLTSQFSALTDPANWVNANGAWSVAYAGWAAPQVTVDGKSVALVESYRDGQEFKLSTGDVMYQDITGLTPGTYAIELYGAACLTPGRNGMTTDFAEGDENSQKGAYLYAKVGDNILKEYVPCLIEDNMNNRGGEEAIPTAKLSGVVVGEEGTVRVGLAKELGLTNWHFVQLKKVIAQVLAKDLFATDLAKMNATIAEAEALNSKEHLTEGKEALANAIEAAQDVVANKQMYNIDEMQAAVTALENAIAAFKLANYVAYEGVAYVQSVATGKYMAAGHDYGTRGIVNETGLDLTFAANAETKKVTIDSQVSNGGDSHFLGSNLYMDSGAFEWIIEKFGENYSISNGEKYLGVDEKDNLALVDDAYAWAIVPDTDVKAARMATLEGATEIDPADATWMMSNPNFNRNDQRVSAWAVSEDCTNKNLNGGNQVNNCAESFHSTFTISQAITGAPAGLYKLTAQGFYRQDQDDDKNDVTEAAPKFFIGTETAEVPARAGEESSMSAASESFANGQYTIAPIEFFYDGENTLTVGVKGTALYQWVIFDNFQLSYLGMPSAVVAEAIDDDYFTFSSKYPVDLDNLPEGLKAYYVNEVKEKEALVEEAPGAVAAGTGLLLKATDKGDYEIPVVAKGNKLDGNLLVGVQEKDAQKPAIKGEGYYVLIDAADGDGVVFSQVNGEASVALSNLVGKAYLYYAGSNAGKLRIAFPGEATAINSLDAEAQKSGKGIYNLSGQKVNAGYKGIVIVNGKKVMMK